MLLWLGHTSGVSLDGLVEQVSRALGEARSLFGAAPAARQWGSTAALSAGREGVARAVGAASQSWQGQGASGYLSGGKNGVAALDSVIDADAGSAAGFDASAGASRSGGTGMDTVINDTRARVAAVAPSTDTPAGKAQLVADLKTQLQRAKALLVVSERRNIELAAMIRAAAGGYRTPIGAGMPAMGGGAMGPAALSGGRVEGWGLPSLAGLTRTAPPTPSPHTRYAGNAGPAAQTAVRAALTRLGRPYVWGAKGPDAFDCAGLVRWSWAQAGITLGPDTYSQIEQGVPVARGDVQPGDMIFPKNSFGEGGRPGPGHVMLAVSGTQCVEAQQSGVPVTISPMPAAFIARRPLTG